MQLGTFMVGITPMGVPSAQVPDYIALIAEPLGIGIGSQGFQKSDINHCSTSVADWCNLFQKYPRGIHELQTYLQSCTNNNCTTGSLMNLIPWAEEETPGDLELEIYLNDWLTAYDPSYPGYDKAYQQVLK